MVFLSKPKQLLSFLLAAIIIFLICPATAPQSQANVSSQETDEVNLDGVKKELGKRIEKLEKGINQTRQSKQYKEITAASAAVANLGIADWLGPMAPVALSPFFAITLLSGAACFGGEWIPENTPLLGEGSPLASPAIFWTFLVLTVLTSLPRMSKVSKPLAQMVDFLETYSAIITLIVLKLITLSPGEADPEIQQAGILAMGWEGLLMVAMVINVVVINTVKFFFEFLVWITPIPALDMAFEVCNKAICAGLMAVYTFSPMLALVLNLILFVICFIMFAWVKRREVFYRAVLVDTVLGWFNKERGKPTEAKLTLFPKQEIESIPTRARCLLEKTQSGWKLTQRRILFKPRVVEFADTDFQPEIAKGWLTCSIHFGALEFTFSRRYAEHLSELATMLSASVREGSTDSDQAVDRRLEFA